MLGEEVQCLALPCSRCVIGGLGRVRAQLPGAFVGRAQRLSASQQHGERVSDRVAQWMQVVLGDPAHQVE